jgi:hypothetical protein
MFNARNTFACVVLPDNFPKIALISVSGAFQVLAAPATPSISNSTAYHLADDLSWVRGTHQVGLGVSHVHNMMNYTSATSAPVQWRLLPSTRDLHSATS